jgi:hypothetical protein
MENAILWYQFVNVTLGREASNGSLYLVTGCDKSMTWGVASISCASGTDTLSLKFTAAEVAEASTTRGYTWETYCPATVRIGPNPDPERLQNQCVFLRGFKVMLQEGLMAKVRGTVKVTSVLDAKADGIIPAWGKGGTVPFSAHKKGAGLPKTFDNLGSKGSQQQAHTHVEDVILEDIPGATGVNYFNTLICFFSDLYLLDVSSIGCDQQIYTTLCTSPSTYVTTSLR